MPSKYNSILVPIRISFSQSLWEGKINCTIVDVVRHQTHDLIATRKASEGVR
jgi:hypothetical protein